MLSLQKSQVKEGINDLRSKIEREGVERGGFANASHASETRSQEERGRGRSFHADDRRSQEERGSGESLHLSHASESKSQGKGVVPPHLSHASGMGLECGGGDEGESRATTDILRSADSHESLLGIKRRRSHSDVPTGANSTLGSGSHIATRPLQNITSSYAVRVPASSLDEVRYITDEQRVPAASSQNVEEVRYIAERRVPASFISDESQQRDEIVAHGRETAEVFADDGERVPASDMARRDFTTAPQVLEGENDASAAFGRIEGEVHEYDGSVEHAELSGDDTQRILADFARFEWPSLDNTGAPPACPGLTADDSLASLAAGSVSLSADSLDCFLAGIEDETYALATSERCATCEDFGHGSELHDMVCKLKESGQGMQSLDPDLLQTLRVIHSSWRRSISQPRLPRLDENSSETLRQPAPMRVRNSFELIDALDDAFLPAVQSHD